jgi:hypothetical protein
MSSSPKTELFTAPSAFTSTIRPNWPYSGVDTSADHRAFAAVIDRIHQALLRLDAQFALLERR